jgi:hypothetical protein
MFCAVKEHSNSYTYLYFISLLIYWLVYSLQDEYDKISREVPFGALNGLAGVVTLLLVVAGWGAHWEGPSHSIALVSIAVSGTLCCLSALVALIRKL